MSNTDPFMLGLGSSPNSKSPADRDDSGDSPAPPDPALIARADRLAHALKNPRTVQPSTDSTADATSHAEPTPPPAPTPRAVLRAVPEGAVATASGEPFVEFEAADAKARHLAAQTGFDWWVRALGDGQFVVVCAATPNASPSRQSMERDEPEEEQDFRTKALDELQLSDFPPGHPVHRFGVKQYKKFAKKHFKFKPSYRSMWPLLILSLIGLVLYLLPVPALRLLPPELLHQTLESISEENLVTAVQYLGLAFCLLALGKVLFQRHYRRYILMPGYAKCEEGIVARKSTKIAYVNVVNYDVQQNPIARILNYGTLELSSAGSDGSEIKMRDVYSPRVVELVLESRMEEARQTQRR